MRLKLMDREKHGCPSSTSARNFNFDFEETLADDFLPVGVLCGNNGGRLSSTSPSS
jgi:hypothetical protein